MFVVDLVFSGLFVFLFWGWKGGVWGSKCGGVGFGCVVLIDWGRWRLSFICFCVCGNLVGIVGECFGGGFGYCREGCRGFLYVCVFGICIIDLV